MISNFYLLLIIGFLILGINQSANAVNASYPHITDYNITANEVVVCIHGDSRSGNICLIYDPNEVIIKKKPNPYANLTDAQIMEKCQKDMPQYVDFCKSLLK